MKEPALVVTSLQYGESITPRAELKWPGNAPFALFLSHDIDQIHDREMWRILADVNHARRVLFGAETGHLGLAVRRIGRSIVRPKSAIHDFGTILEIEARHGFRSTFFVLHDRYWARHGARYRLSDPELRDIVMLVSDAGCEIGLHGSYYTHRDAAAYQAARRAVADEIGVDPVGVRNHYLKIEGSATWEAQAEAGFLYDATFGHRKVLGPKDGRIAPFWAVRPKHGGESNGGSLVELPLTVMDVTLFRGIGAAEPEPVKAAWKVIAPVVDCGGLVTLLWHNTYFGEPEYALWQQVYQELIDRLASLNPWCATGAEIARWWKAAQLGTHSGDGASQRYGAGRGFRCEAGST